jgi:hypothetical protein
VNSTVEINTDPQFTSTSFSDSSYTLKHSLDLSKVINVLALVGCVHLDRLEPLALGILCLSNNVARTVTTNPLVNLDLVTDFATHKLMNRHSIVFALDIPECLIWRTSVRIQIPTMTPTMTENPSFTYPSNCAHSDGSTSIETRTMHDLPKYS